VTGGGGTSSSFGSRPRTCSRRFSTIMLRVSCSFLKLTLQLGHFMKFLPPAPCCAHLFMHELQNVWPQGVIIARGFRGGRKHMGQIVNARMLLMETDPVIDDEDALLSCETCDACDLTELAVQFIRMS